jgi:thiamine biosynthesis lipoprotein
MGVDARLTVYAQSKDSAEKACAAAFERIAALDTIMSDYRRDSELMRLCTSAVNKSVHVSADLFRVLRRARDVSRLSGGAFDITVGPLVTLWRRARKAGQLPSPTEIQAAKNLVGWQKVRLDERRHTVRLAVAGMKLDLGGIAKGYAADEAQKVLKRNGIDRALVELGGDMVVTRPPLGANGWLVKVPNAGKDIRFSNCAISTSGDTVQFVEIAGNHYSHVVDPRTGWALTNRVEVTLSAPNGLTSDPLSTAIGVLGGKGYRRLVRAYPGTRAYVRRISG